MQNVNDTTDIYEKKSQIAHKWQVNTQNWQGLWFHLACHI